MKSGSTFLRRIAVGVLLAWMPIASQAQESPVMRVDVTQIAVEGGDSVTSVNITDGGAGYTSVPTVSFSGGGGAGATATAVVTGGVVTAITLITSGSGYDSAPLIDITGGGGTGATATAIVSDVAATPNEASGDAGDIVYITALAQGTFTTESFTYRFFVNGAGIGESTEATTASFTAAWSPPRPGVYFITVEATDGANTATSPTIRYFATGATITSPLAGTIVPEGSSVTIKADATAAQASIEMMEFFAGAERIGTDDTAPYSLNYTPTASVSFTVRATPSSGPPLDSDPTAITLVDAVGSIPEVSVAAPADESVIAVPADPLTITINANDSDGRITRVETFVDGVLFATDQTFPYTAEWLPVAVGSYGISALGYDDQNNVVSSAVNTIQISAPPAVSITSPANGVSVSAGSSVNLVASASDSDGTVTSVQFFAAGEFVAEDFTAPYTATWIPNEPSDDPSIALVAIAVDNLGLSTASAGVSVSVQGSGGTGGGAPVGNPPTVALTAPVAGSTNNVNTPVLLLAEAEDTDGNITKVQFYANGLLIASDDVYPYSAEWTPTSPANYELEARATDNDGNVTAGTPVVVTIADLSGGLPTVSISSPAAGSTIQTGTSASIIVSAQDLDGSIAEVLVFVDGQPLGAADSVAPYVFIWEPGSSGNYSLTARATDTSGNIATSAAVSVTVADASSAPPQVSIVTPTASDSLVAGTSTSIIASAFDPDGQVASVQFFVDGRPQGAPDQIEPFVVPWTPTASGNYSLQAVAVDGSGNQTTSSTVTISVIGNNAPQVRLTSPQNGATISAGAVLSLVATASDSDGEIASVTFLANGVIVGSDATAPFAIDWIPGAATGYVIKARATDNSGNVTDSASINVTATDNQAPTVSLLTPVNGGSAALGSAIELIADASDEDGTITSVEFYANGIPVGTATGSPFAVIWSPIVEGVYAITARAIDNGGNIATTSEVYFAIVNVASDDVETVYGGTYIAALDNEQGEFTMVRRGSTSASFLARSQDGSQIYTYNNIPVDIAGNFRLIEGGQTRIEGQFVGSSAVGTFKNGNALMVGTAQQASPTFTGPSGTSYGSMTGAGDSEVVVVSAPNGEVTVYLDDGSSTDVGFGNFDSAGNFTVLTAGGRTVTGELESSSGFLTGRVSGMGSFTGAVSSAASVSDGFLRNLSTRGNVGSGENVLIVGFVVNGRNTKQVLIRAVGPTLADNGVTGAIADPTLSVFNSAGTIVATNDNWSNDPAVLTASNTVGAFPLPAASLDAALVSTLAPGAYTAQVTGIGGATGVGLVEIYDVDTQTPFSSEKVLNVSTRGRVGSGDERLIAGVVINGTTPKRVLIRAVGPTLSTLGVNGSLADPTLRLIRQDNGLTVRENDDWGRGNDASVVTNVAAEVGAFALPAGSKDAALLITLPPGVYTAIVGTATGASGIALVEVYEVP
jgi:hypothetical protein